MNNRRALDNENADAIENSHDGVLTYAEDSEYISLPSTCTGAGTAALSPR